MSCQRCQRAIGHESWCIIGWQERQAPEKPLEVHDFRDYPQPDRPEWDQDPGGRRIKPGS